MKISVLQRARSGYVAKLPPVLRNGAHVRIEIGAPTSAIANSEKIAELFPNNFGKPEITFSSGKGQADKPINAGVILSGGQAPGGHNVIAGIFDGLKSIHADSRLFGFLGGPSGLIDNKYIEITSKIVDDYRNTGGFDMIASGRTKLEEKEQFDKAKSNCDTLGIKAIVVVGGDDSNTNACLLAEYYEATNAGIQVVGCPKTIDGDLKNEFIEASFGFDTACKVYSELIGNIQRDANSARKYWHFIKLMGRSASHITLECALQTHPNITLIGEEVLDRKQTLDEIVDEIVATIVERSNKGDDFGVVLVPEGLIEFIPEMKTLIAKLNDLLAKESNSFAGLKGRSEQLAFVNHHLGKDSSYVFSSLPVNIQSQLMLDRDPHGNVQVSLIDTEKLLAEMASLKLMELKNAGKYEGKFAAHSHFFGYEGRCAAPSNYDADYCYSLGYTAAAIMTNGQTGYMSSVRNTNKPADQWICGGIPITMMMNIERRHGKDKPVIQKALVKLDGEPFIELQRHQVQWASETSYIYPGPIQYFGPSEVCDQITKTLELEKKRQSQS
ncbi:MAG: diphosphate--fructose-6-phosphate 1-phosphotransferase [Kiritimatiellaeota bacterium]|nr:diphosphate--fructose-6-phosphate 1-phosphotransferase [Kiritimatiellota bacterium]